MAAFFTLKGRPVPVARSGVDLVRIRALAQQVQGQHRLRGALAELGDWMLGVKFPTHRHAESASAAACYRWDGVFGSWLTLTFAFPGEGWVARGWISVDHPMFAQLIRTRQLPLLTVYNNSPVSVVRLEFVEAQEAATVAHLTRPESDVKRPGGFTLEFDEELAHLESFLMSSAWNSLLRPEDQLQIGWLDVFRAKLRDARATALMPVADSGTAADRLFEADEATYQRLVVDAGLDRLPRETWFGLVRDLVDVFKGRRSLLEFVRTANSWDLIYLLAEPAAEEPERHPLHQWRNGIGAIAYAASFNDRETHLGTKIVSIDQLTKHKEVGDIPVVWRTEDQARAFWPNTPEEFTHFGQGVIALDMQPAVVEKQLEEIRKIRLSCPLDEAKQAIRTLTEEANILNQWTIPWAARVQIALGPFKEIDFYPFGDEINILLLNEKGEYSWAAFNLRQDAWNLQHLVRDSVKTYLDQEGDQAWLEEMEVALQLVITAIVRDFVVVERRESVFDCRRVTPRERKGLGTGPLIVYIPRIDYQRLDPRPAALEEHLEYSARRPHHVKPHLRKADNARPSQVLLARRYGLTVTDGYTFVRPHQRGGIEAEREVIYRSRSALQSLFGAAAAVAGGVASEWFQFERDVKTVMESAGYRVDHVASSRNGDHGIDLTAEEGDDGKTWVIQCKCYSPDRKVGPATVRELLGTLASTPEGTRGMLATTSGFTKGALKLAQDKGIELRIMRRDLTGLLMLETVS